MVKKVINSFWSISKDIGDHKLLSSYEKGADEILEITREYWIKRNLFGLNKLKYSI